MSVPGTAADGRDRTSNIGTLSENVAKYEESDPEPTIAELSRGRL